MTEEMLIIIGTITGMLSVPMITFLTLMYNMVKDTKDKTNSIKIETSHIKNEVQNSHATNLRDDLDDKHGELVHMMQKLDDKFETRIENMEKEITNDRDWNRKKFDRFWNMYDKLSRRLKDEKEQNHVTD